MPQAAHTTPGLNVKQNASAGKGFSGLGDQGCVRHLKPNKITLTRYTAFAVFLAVSLANVRHAHLTKCYSTEGFNLQVCKSDPGARISRLQVRTRSPRSVPGVGLNVPLE